MGKIAKAVFDEVRAYCSANADPVRAKKYARFFTEGFDPYGVDHTHPSWDENKLKWADRLRKAGPTAFLDAGDLLVKTGKYEDASFAILIAKELRELYTPEAFDRIGRWFEGGIQNWGHTDVCCGEVLKPFLTDGIVKSEALVDWTKSKWKYKRRAAAVAMIPLAKQQRNLAPLLKIIKPLMLDEERVVHQGAGWFLREAWKMQPEPIEAFLMKHRETAPRLIFQYATEKMDKAGKARFRRGA